MGDSFQSRRHRNYHHAEPAAEDWSNRTIAKMGLGATAAGVMLGFLSEVIW